MTVHAKGDVATYATHDLLAEDVGREVGDGVVGLESAHSASYVDTYGIGDYHSVAGHDSAYGHALASVDIGHDGEVMVDEGELAERGDLVESLWLDAVGPYLHDGVVELHYFHCSSCLSVSKIVEQRGVYLLVC